jgi:hypothetical protein
MGSYEIVLNAALLLLGRGSGADGNLAEYLARVGVYDGNMKILSHTEAEFGLAYARGAEYH